MRYCHHLIAVGVGIAWFSCNSLENLALYKAAYQSDVYSVGSPDGAVDGNTDGTFRHGSCMHTKTKKDAWWAVDLGQVYRIYHLKLFSRTDCDYCKVWSRDVELYIGYTNDNYVLRGFYDGILWPSNTFELASPVYGRWVKITRPSYVDDAPLIFCEVQVFGEEIGHAVRFELRQGMIGTGALLDSTQARSKTECCLQCMKTDNCLALNYNSATQLCDKLETVAATDDSNGNIYFFRYP